MAPIHYITMTVRGKNWFINVRMYILLGLYADNWEGFTEDIDFSTSMQFTDINEDRFREKLEEALLIASAELPYQMICTIQSLVIQPKDAVNTTFPSFKFKIGYAHQTNEGVMVRLKRGQAVSTVKIDYIILTDYEELQAYSFTDLVAEKIRSVILIPSAFLRLRSVQRENTIRSKMKLKENSRISIWHTIDWLYFTFHCRGH